MEAIFLKLLNMSITASWLVLAVIVLRLLLKKAPKAIIVVMWALVGIRLICPFSFESILSLIPSAETIPTNIIYSDSPAIQSGIPALNEVVNPIISDSLAPAVGNSVNPIWVITFVASVIWVAGMAMMLLYTVISYLRIHRKVCEATPSKENIWLCDHIFTPFIFGVICPRIYLPSAMCEQDMEYVIAHEKAHLKRRDHLWKPLGFLLLTIYWFNPILWVAYVLLCRDIELACDEKVIIEMGALSKKPYSDALINCSVPRKMISACPLAFGEDMVKGRIKSVLNYERPAFWVIAIAVIACVAVAIGFLTDPETEKRKSDRTYWPLEDVIPVEESTPNLIISDTSSTLKEKYPQYFELDTSKGLDEFGLTMGITFNSATEFDVIFTHSSQMTTMTGTLTTSPQYDIRAYHNGEWISFGNYMRNVLNYDYADPDLGWDDVLYTIKTDDTLVLHENLQVTYGSLPVGQYLLCKIVKLTTDSGEVIEKVYSAQIAVID